MNPTNAGASAAAPSRRDKPVARTGSGGGAAVDLTPYAGLTDEEKKHPFNVTLLCSAAVLEAEIAAAQQKPSSSFEAEMRAGQLETQYQILVMRIENGQLDQPGYLAMVEERIRRDKFLAQYFLKVKGEQSTAISIMKRVKVMQKECTDLKAALAGGGGAAEG